MPHIIILEIWMSILTQLDGYSHQVQVGINDNAYSGKQLVLAQELIDRTTAFMNDINASFRSRADEQAADFEAFLGI